MDIGIKATETSELIMPWWCHCIKVVHLEILMPWRARRDWQDYEIHKKTLSMRAERNHLRRQLTRREVVKDSFQLNPSCFGNNNKRHGNTIRRPKIYSGPLFKAWSKLDCWVREALGRISCESPMWSRVCEMVQLEPCCVLLVFACLCFDISRVFSLGNEYETVSPDSSWRWLGFSALVDCTCTIPPLRHSPLCYSLSLTFLDNWRSTKQDAPRIHFDTQSTLKTPTARYSTRCKPIVMLFLKIGNPSLDQPKPHGLPQLKFLVTCLIHGFARAPIEL